MPSAAVLAGGVDTLSRKQEMLTLIQVSGFIYVLSFDMLMQHGGFGHPKVAEGTIVQPPNDSDFLCKLLPII